MSRASDEQSPKKAGSSGSEPLERRAAIKALVGIGLATGLQACGSLPEPAQPAPAQPEPVPPGPEPDVGDPAAPTASDSPLPPAEHDHPADGDHLVFSFGDREGQVIRPEDLVAGSPQVFAVPMDADASHVARESRLDQVILVRLDPSEMSDETAARAASGIVAYSAICTHTGCEIDDWDEDTHRFQCPCHDSEFDPADNGQVAGGPARRRLAALPLKIETGILMAAGGFTGRVGGERRGADFTNL